MAKFNKDTFITDITTKVKEAIESEVISKKDISSNDTERLKNFIQYCLSDVIEDRTAAISILKDFNYDERLDWTKLEDFVGGKISSLEDLALVNIWMFLHNQGMLNYSYYNNQDMENDEVEIIDNYDEDEFEDEFEDVDDIEEVDDFDEDDEVEEAYTRGRYRRY